MSDLLPDEACHMNESSGPITAAELLGSDHSGDVMLHNTMRFDVQMAHVQFLLDDEGIDKEVLASVIREAIIGAVDEVLGTGLDGIGVRDSLMVSPVTRSQMLHRETLHFDFS